MSDCTHLYDVIIIGGGPAGLSAAIYAGRAKERVLVIEENGFGGQIALTEKVVNYPGVPACSGRELISHMIEQAKSFGAELIRADVLSMELEEPIKKINTGKGEFSALGVILATGASPRDAGFKGEKEFTGMGVSYCATCDGALFANCELFVVGGGLAAVEEAIYLTRYSQKITLVVRENDFLCPKSVTDRLKLYPCIKVKFHTQIVQISGEITVDKVIMKDVITGKICTRQSDGEPMGVFVFVGYEPNTRFLPEALKRDKEGYLVTDAQNKTNLSGVCAAGDVRQKSLRQVVTAAADGAVAAVSLEPVVKLLHQTYNIPELVEDKEEQNPLKKVAGHAVVKIWADDSELSAEMISFLNGQHELRDKVTLEIHEEGREDILLPAIEICKNDGSSSGIYFHAVPKGLEWNSFAMALFNVAGPGQKLSADTVDKIKSIHTKLNLKVMATLTCGNCPTSVMSACQIAAFNENVTAEMFDLVYFRKLSYKYRIQSVPVLVVNDDIVIRGKMNVEEMIKEILFKLSK